MTEEQERVLKAVQAGASIDEAARVAGKPGLARIPPKGTVMLRVGLIGYGYWGPNLARNINAHEACELVRVADTLENRRRAEAERAAAAELAAEAAR